MGRRSPWGQYEAVPLAGCHGAFVKSVCGALRGGGGDTIMTLWMEITVEDVGCTAGSTNGHPDT